MTTQTTYRNPTPTVDVIIELSDDRVVLIERANPPLGWAWPGGFVDYGETVESAAVREAKEETCLDVTLTALLGVYSAPDRDPRQHNLSIVYVAKAEGEPTAGDDAARVHVFDVGQLGAVDFAFDHAQIASDYMHYRATGQTAGPR